MARRALKGGRKSNHGGARAAEMAVWLRRHGIDASYLVGGYSQWTGSLDRG